MRIVVLGASGQIGSVIYEMLRRHYEVVGTSRKQSSGLFQFDPFRDNWSKLGKSDIVVNCVGQIEATTNFSFYKIHLELSKLIIDNREVVGNPRIIQISALGAAANHKVEFLRTRGLADDYILQHPNTVVARPSIICTHRTMIVKKMLMLLQISNYTQGVVFVPSGFLNREIQPMMPQDLSALIKTLCTATDLPRIINVVGPERLSYHQIINLLFDTQRKKYRLVQVPKILTDVLIKYGISFLLPKLINSQQYQLLFQDNIADVTVAEGILGRRFISTKPFFKNEFSYASH